MFLTWLSIKFLKFHKIGQLINKLELSYQKPNLLIFNIIRSIITKKAFILKKIHSILLSISFTVVNALADSDTEICQYIASGKLIKEVYDKAYICPSSDNEYAHHFAVIDSEALKNIQRIQKKI